MVIHGHQIKASVIRMRMANGKLARNDTESAKVFKEHFKKLYNNKDRTTFDPTIINEIREIEENPEIGTVPTEKEVCRFLE